MEIHQLPISQHHHHYLHPNHLNHFGNNFVDSIDKQYNQASTVGYHYHTPELIDINSNISNSTTTPSLNNIIRFDQIKLEKNSMLSEPNIPTAAAPTPKELISSNGELANRSDDELLKRYKTEKNLCGNEFKADRFCEVLQQQHLTISTQRSPTTFYDVSSVSDNQNKSNYMEMTSATLACRSSELQKNHYRNGNSLLNYQEPSSSAASSLSASSSLSDVMNIKCLASSNAATDRKRPYPCTLCPSRFGSKMELEEHQNSHTGMKPFQCDICQSQFNRRSTLWNHKRIHSDAKPFVCTVCQMTFKWKNSLKCHKEMHFRKNETSTIQDNDIRLLTYATAAKRQLSELSAENDKIRGKSMLSDSGSLIEMGSTKRRSLYPNQQNYTKIKTPFTNLKMNKATPMTASNRKNCGAIVVLDSGENNLIKQEFIKNNNVLSDTKIKAVINDEQIRLISSTNRSQQLMPSSKVLSNQQFELTNKPFQHDQNIKQSKIAFVNVSKADFLNTMTPMNNANNNKNENLNILENMNNGAVNFSTIDALPINDCNLELNYQSDLFLQLENESKNNLLEQERCANRTVPLNMQMPILNFDLQQLNNTLAEQQTHHLQNSNPSAFESFQLHQHQQHHNASIGLPYDCGNRNFNLATHSDTLLGSYPVINPAFISAAAAAAATASVNPSRISTVSAIGESQEISDNYFGYHNTLVENSNTYNSQLTNSIQNCRNNTNETNLMVSSSSLTIPQQTMIMMQQASNSLSSTNCTSTMVHNNAQNYVNY